MKRLYKIGCDDGLGRRELFSLEDEQNRLERPCPQPQEGAGTTKWPKDTEFINTAIQMLARVEEGPETPIQYDGDHTAFMIRCVMIAREWRGNVPPNAPIVRDFGDFELRCQVAVNMRSVPRGCTTRRGWWSRGSTTAMNTAALRCAARGDHSRLAPLL